MNEGDEGFQGGGTQRLPVLEKDEKGERAAPSELDQSASAASYKPVPTPDEDGSGPWMWSVRRVPAAVVGVLGAGAAGLLLYDFAAVRAHRTAVDWRRELARTLAARPLDDVWVLLGAGAAVALGVWLLVLAATPGRRSFLAMRAGDPEVRAWLDTGAAALVLRDRAMEVSGVQSVRVRMRRHSVDVRAVAHFRQLDDVRADLDATLGEGIRGLGLAQAPGLSVRVSRPGKRG
ncbi:DUF6286 domain-containing protein [Streptomyces sp. NBC_01304]|uniref:DUF6286 domain-containing protein n=1 Tax=Streptomyces sp. NBC_01304 TaxID=2903818 RepID=UPI002E1461C3|nr:DUF6286 domain-containing protein [Streptomyces sp. NBC_01304]